jgi:hypothetical protein
MKTIWIYCTVCKQDVAAQECYGRHIYLRRPDLDDKRFYMCPTCGNYVGTHKDGRPLGTIPSPELRDQRKWVHNVIDPYWLEDGYADRAKRKQLYSALSEALGKEYHTGNLNSREECVEVVSCYVRLRNSGIL